MEISEQKLHKLPLQSTTRFPKESELHSAAFNLQETIYHNIDLGSNVYGAFLDIQKAFDTVWHDGLLYKLHNLGIQGKLWRLLRNYYKDLVSHAKINGVSSQIIPVTRSVRQGGVISTFFYLVFIDELLTQLESSHSGATVCSVSSGNPTLADDITCLATSPTCLQQSLDIVYKYATRWRFAINVDKSRIVVFTKSNNNA